MMFFLGPLDTFGRIDCERLDRLFEDKSQEVAFEQSCSICSQQDGCPLFLMLVHRKIMLVAVSN